MRNKTPPFDDTITVIPSDKRVFFYLELFSRYIKAISTASVNYNDETGVVTISNWKQ